MSIVLASAELLTAHGQSAWRMIGPDGGDARSLVSVPGQPSHLYLGTANSTVYESLDGGASWKRLARLDPADDMVIAHIVLDKEDSSRILVAAWRYDKPEGGLYISRDGGRNWSQDEGLKNQAVFSLVQAPSDPKIVIAGTLEGVYRSEDAGGTWTEISPVGNQEIHEVESLAVNPVNPDIIYAGTWHLPWKTVDGGKHWENIKQGVIEDSDVFSIIVDSKSPSIVYASACSGIYKSETAGALFHKIQGIPSTARRTRKLMQDPQNRETVYAGTTEGLYKTTDGGRTFQRMTGPDVIVNDVWIDPENTSRVLLATDRGGVLASNDSGVTFTASNRGFSARRVEALLVDAQDSSRIFAGVVNDKRYGGAFVSTDGGGEWKQVADGLNGRDVFALDEAADGTVVAGTNSGIFALPKDGTAWTQVGMIPGAVTTKTETKIVHGKRVKTEKQVQADPVQISSWVHAVAVSGDVWAAATASGIYTSHDQGATWAGGAAADGVDYRSIAAHGDTLAAAQTSALAVSTDAGKSWTPVTIPTAITRVYRLLFSADGTLWMGTREGVYFSHDEGKSWMWIQRLPMRDVSGLTYDANKNLILVSSHSSDFIYAMDAKTLAWHWQRTGYPLFQVRAAGNRLLAASVADGVLAERGAEKESGEAVGKNAAQE